MSDHAFTDEYLERAREKIAEYGFIVQGLFPGKGTELVPRVTWPYTYTVGLVDSWGFEVITVMGPTQAHPLLNALARMHPNGPPLNRYLRGLIEPPYMPVLIRGRRDPDWPVHVADTIAGRDVDLAQLCWPDDKFRYPWSASYTGPEPLLGDAPVEVL